MARAALQWTVRDLAKAAGLHPNTISNLEIERFAGDAKTWKSIEKVLIHAGLEFIEKSGSPGVCVRTLRPVPAKPSAGRDRYNINAEFHPKSMEIPSIGVDFITTGQLKAARALLGWSQNDLARRSGVSEPTIARLESVDGELGGREDTAEKLRNAVEAAGVEFIEENGGGPGVRLRKSHRLRTRK